MIKKVIIALCVALVIFAVGYNSYQSQQKGTADKKSVYVSVQLTGPVALAGKHVKAAMDSWMEMHPDASFELVYVDNESRPDRAVTGMQQKTLDDKHPITLTIGSIYANVIFPVMKNRNGFNFSIMSFNSIVEGYDNAQNLSSSLADVMQPIVDKVNQNYKSVGIISSLDEFGRQETNYFVKHLNPDIQKFAVDFPLNQQDIRLEMHKLLLNKPEVVVILITPSMTYQNVLRELKHNYSGKILADLAFENNFLSEIATGSDMDIETVISKTNMRNQNLKEFEQKLKNKNSYLFYTTKQSYDALDIIDYAIKNNMPLSQNTFERIGHWAGMNNITFTGKGHSSIEYVLVPFKDGQFIQNISSEER